MINALGSFSVVKLIWTPRIYLQTALLHWTLSLLLLLVILTAMKLNALDSFMIVLISVNQVINRPRQIDRSHPHV